MEVFMTNILLTPYDGAILGPIAKILGWIMDVVYVFMYETFGIENVGLSIIILTIIIYTLMYNKVLTILFRNKCV